MVPARVRIRMVLAGVAFLAALCLLPLRGKQGETGKPVAEREDPSSLNRRLTNAASEIAELEPMDRKIRQFMQQWSLQGVSLCVMRHDSLLYAKGYGWADKEMGIPMEPATLLRVASVSKLVTAAGIMVLRDRGLLRLDSPVFGPDGILCDSAYTARIKDPNYFKITVGQLLRHQGGFTLRAGDPMFSTRTVMQQYRLKTPPDARALLRCLLGRRLSYAPGTSHAYSNLGYLILSLVIEQVSGEPYEQFMRREVLKKAGCFEFYLAGNYYKDRRPRESRYYMHADPNGAEVEDFHGNGVMVERCYGGNDIHALLGAGAWICSVPELARFTASIDGQPGVPDIISPGAVDLMTRTEGEGNYGLGWNECTPERGWSRSGTFSGTSALIRCFPDGECWILVTNSSTWKGPRFQKWIAGLFNKLKESWSDRLPRRDLFSD